MGLIYFRASNGPAGTVDGQRIVEATAAYANDLRARGWPVPPEVSLKDLIALRHLKASDVRGLAGLDVTVNLLADPRRPQDVLLRARLAGGDEMVTLVDGTVQQIPAAKTAK
jgi:hypothetical protein